MAWKALQPYLGLDMTFKAVNEALNNRKEGGRKVFNVDKDLADQGAEIREHFWKTFEPGTFTSARRLYRSLTNPEINEYQTLNPKHELFAIFPGLRITQGNIATSMKFKGFDFKQRVSDAKKDYKMAKRNKKTGKELEDAKKLSQRTYNNVYKELIDQYRAAASLSGKPKLIKKQLKEAGFSNRDIRYISAQKIPPLKFK